MEIIKPNLAMPIGRQGVAPRAIKLGKVLVCPTDTVYGLVCDAANKKAVGKLYRIKKRPKHKPIPVFVSDMKMAKKIAKIDSRQEKYLQRVWPGAVTAVLQKNRGRGTIGIRIPNHKFALNLTKHAGPLAETSANISGQPASGKIEDVLQQFTPSRTEGPDLIIDAGNLPKHKPSKVIDLTVWPPKILRY